VSTRVLAKILE